MKIQAHGVGVSQDFLLTVFLVYARYLRLADEPNEVHIESVAKMELNKHRER
jgi:acyl-CoA dehydrogenase